MAMLHRFRLEVADGESGPRPVPIEYRLRSAGSVSVSMRCLSDTSLTQTPGLSNLSTVWDILTSYIHGGET